MGTGWGQGTGTPTGQGDTGVGVLSTSQHLTAKAQVDRTASALADAVDRYFDGGAQTTAKADEMHTCLAYYRGAKAVLSQSGGRLR